MISDVDIIKISHCRDVRTAYEYTAKAVNLITCDVLGVMNTDTIVLE
jgi:hypothetical protein